MFPRVPGWTTNPMGLDRVIITATSPATPPATTLGSCAKRLWLHSPGPNAITTWPFPSGRSFVICENNNSPSYERLENDSILWYAVLLATFTSNFNSPSSRLCSKRPSWSVGQSRS